MPNCPVCCGSGYIDVYRNEFDLVEYPCSACNETGEVEEYELSD